MNWKVQLAFGSAILTLLVMGAISFSSRIEAKESQRWILHTHEVLANLELMEEQLAHAESDRSMYLTNGDSSAAGAFEADMAKARLQLETIQGLTSDNLVQQRRLKSLDALLMQEEQELAKNAGPVVSRNTSHDPYNLNRDKPVGELTDQLQKEELRLLKVRTDGNGRRLERNGATLLIRVMVGVSITIVAAWSVQREGARRSRAELALRQGEERIRGLLLSAPDPWIVLDPEGKILLLNAQTETQFGYSQKELLGLGIGALLPQGLPQKRLPGEVGLSEDSFRDSTSKSPEEGQTGFAGNTVVVLGQRKDGSRFPAEMTLSSFETKDGVLISAALRNIEERRKSERHLEEIRQELERSNQELQRFAYVTSHDLQEPLRMVASYVQLLARRYRGQLDGDADEFIGYAVDGCIRMKRLIQDLLAYSRAGAEEKSLRSISIETVVDHALANLRSAIKESGAEIIRDPLPALVADEMQLVQIFQNLIGNAIKYRRPSALRIHISATRGNAEEWIFSVQDNGQGIEPTYFEKIFVIFQRLQADKGSDGTGIGLAICKRMIERFGGRIWVESEPGVGSTFYFTLPLQQVSAVSGKDYGDVNREILQREPALPALSQEQLIRSFPQV